MIPSLTGGFFAAVTIGLALALPFTVILVAVRTRRRGGPLPWFGQGTLIVLSQAAAIIAVLVFINDQYGLYASWDDLLGITPPASAASFGPQVRSETATVGTTVTHVPWRNGLPQGFARDSNPNTFSTTIHVPGSGVPIPAYVMLPKQYFQAKYAHTDFPTLILLPGYPGTPEAFLHRMNLQKHLQNAVSNGGTPFVLVITQEAVQGGKDLECMNLPKQPQIQTYLTTELPQIVMTHFRVRTDRTGWGFLGYSEGAYCGMQLTLRFPHLFSAAVSIAGYAKPLSPYFAKLPKSYTDAGDIARLLDTRPDVAILATESLQDKQGGNVFAAMKHALPPTLVKTVLYTTGGHNTQSFEHELETDFRWISDHMARV